jgi:hypothetical protein
MDLLLGRDGRVAGTGGVREVDQKMYNICIIKKQDRYDNLTEVGP